MKTLSALLVGCLAALTAHAETFRDPRAAEFYQQHPEFFRFAQPGDLPKDLDWKDGSEQPEFADPRAIRGGTLHQMMITTPPTLRRVGANANNGFRADLYENNDLGLLGSHPNTDEPIPGIALRWALSKDGLTAYFQLDPKARFTDGQPVTADDFFYTFYFFRSPWADADWYADFYSKEFGGITRYDDHTIAVHAPRLRPRQLEWLGALGPTPREFFKDFGPDYLKRYNDRQQPTTGAYYVPADGFRRNHSVTLQRVKEWWAEERRFYRHRYNPDAIQYLVIREMDNAYESLMAGELDFMLIGLPRFWYGANEKPAYQLGYLTKVQFYNDIPRPPYGLYINTQKPGLDDRDVRIGLQHATDFQRVIDGFYRGDFERLNQFSEGLGQYTDPSIRARRYSPELARAAFAKAGYTQVGARRCGVEYVPETLEHTTMYRKVMEKNHDICFWAWSVSSRVPAFWESHHSDNALETLPDGRRVPKRQTNNITGIDNPELSKLIDEFRVATKEADMIRLSFRIQNIMHEDADFIPGWRVPGYRVGHWNWVKFPESFDVRGGDEPLTFGLYWLDPAERKKTLADFRAGLKRGEPKSVVHDKHRVN
ncbi:MAG: ABC transporter substrate-binding protein [Verrucomicrobiae bacterium]|nr:ABC transporter substrate-binding protein [Verrucomicrobiae bacterium]